MKSEHTGNMQVKGGDELLALVKGKTTVLMPKLKSYAQALAGKGLYPKNYLKKNAIHDEP